VHTGRGGEGGGGVGSLEAREWDERVAQKRGKDAARRNQSANVSSPIEVLQVCFSLWVFWFLFFVVLVFSAACFFWAHGVYI